MYCKNCGHQSDGNYCPKCGTKLEIDDISIQVDEFDRSCLTECSNKSNHNSNEIIKKQLKRWLPVIIPIFLICIALIVVSCCNNTKYDAIKSTTRATEKTQATESEPFYYKLTTDELYDDYEYYYDEHIITTIKVTEIDTEDGVYSYTVYDLGEFDKVTFSAFINTYADIEVGDYITIGGKCDYSDSIKGELTIDIFVEKWLERDLDLFQSVGSEAKPTTKPTTKPTEKPTASIKNNTSTDGFYAKGSGDYVATGLNVTNYGVLHIEYTGSGNFSIVSYEGDDYDELLVNHIGNYKGDVLIDHSGIFDLEIQGEGSWNITSSGLTIDDTTSFSGTGDGVTGITTHDGGIWEITNVSDGHFSVVQYGMTEGYMDLLVNEIGNYNGTVKVDSGDNIFFEVTSTGRWTIKKK